MRMATILSNISFDYKYILLAKNKHIVKSQNYTIYLKYPCQKIYIKMYCMKLIFKSDFLFNGLIFSKLIQNFSSEIISLIFYSKLHEKICLLFRFTIKDKNIENI